MTREAVLPLPLLPSRGPGRIDVHALVDRYVALWLEPDAADRRRAVERLFRPDAVHVLAPPDELRDAAARVGFPDSPLELHGHDALEHRVATAHEEFVAPGEYTFRARGKATRIHDLVLFDWLMVPVAGGDPVGGGFDVLLLDEHGLIRVDYQMGLD
jgi:hypothetical protein